MTTNPPTRQLLTPHSIRFGYLTALCFALGRQGCTSMLINPRTGETVLWVPYVRHPKSRLGVGVVESGRCWLFNWSGHQWNPADDVEGTAARIAAIVSAP